MQLRMVKRHNKIIWICSKIQNLKEKRNIVETRMIALIHTILFILSQKVKIKRRSPLQSKWKG